MSFSGIRAAVANHVWTWAPGFALAVTAEAAVPT